MLQYNNYTLIEPIGNQIKRIESLINNNNGSIFHDFDLNSIVQKNFKSTLYYFVDNPNNINSFSPVHLVKQKFGIKRYNFMPLGDIPYAGFVGKKKVNIKNISIGFFESMRYAGFPYLNNRNEGTNNLYIGETNMVDLSLPEDEIFAKVIHSKRRNMIRKALKSGISIKTFFTKEGFDQFWPILEQLHKKLNYSNLTKEYYLELFQKYSNSKKAFISIAYKDNKPISGVFILGNNNFMHYYKGASVFGIKNEGQNELLQWEAIKLSKSLGSKLYDLCNLEKNKLPGIFKFKTGISQNIIKYPKYNQNNFGYKILNRI